MACRSVVTGFPRPVPLDEQDVINNTTAIVISIDIVRRNTLVCLLCDSGDYSPGILYGYIV